MYFSTAKKQKLDLMSFARRLSTQKDIEKFALFYWWRIYNFFTSKAPKNINLMLRG